MEHICSSLNIIGLIFMFFFLSATWPSAVQRMANSYLSDPIKVFVGTLDLAVSLSLYFQGNMSQRLYCK